jgi:hypothetical protein
MGKNICIHLCNPIRNSKISVSNNYLLFHLVCPLLNYHEQVGHNALYKGGRYKGLGH